MSKTVHVLDGNTMVTTAASLTVLSLLRRFAWGIVATILFGTACWLLATERTGKGRLSMRSSEARSIQSIASIEPRKWSIFAPAGLAESKSIAGQGWRLAGTFFSFPEAGLSLCKAILDDVRNNEQRLVAEGDQIEEIEIVRIYPDHVLMRTPIGEETLWLSFSEGGRQKSEKEERRPEEEVATSTFDRTRYGTRIGESRWVMSRAALLEYYRELTEDPERAAKLYVSMKPEYSDDGGIQGYRVNKVGEEEFFEAVGLKEGDVIRKVNSLKMASRARAEYFISEFLQGRLSAAVLDIERDGQAQKLIYFIR